MKIKREGLPSVEVMPIKWLQSFITHLVHEYTVRLANVLRQYSTTVVWIVRALQRDALICCVWSARSIVAKAERTANQSRVWYSIQAQHYLDQAATNELIYQYQHGSGVYKI